MANGSSTAISTYMTKLEEDSIGNSLLLQCREKDAWRLLRSHFALEDPIKILGSFSRSSHYTRRSSHGTRFDQSRFDHFF